MNTRRCEHCGERLSARHAHNARFCSTRCRVAAHRARRALPVELRRARRWVHRGERKQPVRADNGRAASSTDAATWAAHTAAVRSRYGRGLGYVLAEGDGVVCIDLDHCLTDGVLAGWAGEIVDRCPATFVEVSPSGTGLHIWGRGRVARGRRIRRGDGAHIEVYGQGRYIALGRRFEAAPTVLGDLSGVIASLA